VDRGDPAAPGVPPRGVRPRAARHGPQHGGCGARGRDGARARAQRDDGLPRRRHWRGARPATLLLPPYGPHYDSLASDLPPSLWVPGKWTQAEESACSNFYSTQAIVHGALDTGDLGQIDAATGLLTVHGRAAHRLQLRPAAPGGAALLNPTAFEARLAALLPFLAHAVVCAPRGAPFPVCLLAVRTLPGEVPSQRRAAKDVEVAPEARALLAESRADAKDAMTVADVRESPVVIARIVSGIQACPLPLSAIWLL